MESGQPSRAWYASRGAIPHVTGGRGTPLAIAPRLAYHARPGCPDSIFTIFSSSKILVTVTERTPFPCSLRQPACETSVAL